MQRLIGYRQLSAVIFGMLLSTPGFGQVYNISDEAHFPDITMPFNSSDNPLAGNVWVYGFRDTGAGGVNQPLWNDNSFDVFTPFDRFENLGANVIGGAASFGDINTMCQQNFASCAAAGNGGAEVKIVDRDIEGSGVGPTAHVVAGVDSFVKGTVHLFTDDDAPTDRAAIIRFTPPAAGTYEIDVHIENRAADGPNGNTPTYHVVVARGGGFFETFDVLSEAVLPGKVFDANLGLGNGTFVEINQTVTLGALDHIELAAMGSGAFPGVPIAVVGTISTVAGIQPTGDYNSNGFVDAADYVVWRNTLTQTVGTPGSGADGDKSGTIDAGDYTFWKARFGTAVGSGTVAGVAPEPAAISMAIVGALLSVCTYRQRKSAA